MAGLAEDHLQAPSAGRRAVWIAVGVVAIVAVGLLGWWLQSQFSKPTAAKRQVAKISLLPDTPPPPPPPPKEEPKPQPRDDAKAPPPDLAPKVAPAPAAANEPLKMEGPAGDGPSVFGAGTVRNDYAGGNPVLGAGGASRAGAPVADRAQERLYANTSRQLLRDAIEKHLRADATELTAEFTVALTPDGAIQRLDLVPGGDAAADKALQAALDDTRRSLRLPTPPAGLRPMRFKLTVRPQG